MIALLGGALAWADPEIPHGGGVRWSTVETRFFQVHYAEGPSQTARATAQEAARLCDPLLLRISADAGFVPRGPYHLVVADSVEGMVAYSLPETGVVVIGADPGNAVLRLRGRIDWVEDALAHELSHLVWSRRTTSFAQSAGFGVDTVAFVEAGSVAAALDLPFASDLPYGFSEGLAELGSERAGVNRFDSRREGILATSALAGRLLSWDEWLVGVDKGDVFDAERAYQQGYSFVSWLREVYGTDTLRDVGAALAARHRSDLGRVLEAVTGTPGRTLWGRHRAHLLARAIEADARRIALGVTGGTELEPYATAEGLSARDRAAVRPPRVHEADRESTGAYDLYPQRSEDGRFYVEGKSGFVRVVRTEDPSSDAGSSAWIPAETGLATRFVPGEDALLTVSTARPGRPGWWPTPGAERTRLWRVSLASRDGVLVASTNRGLRGAAVVVPGTERARDVAVSPSGAVVFVRHADGTDTLVSLDGGRVLSSFPFGTWLQSPSFAPDGRRLAISVFRENRGELWLMDVPEGRWERLDTGFTDVLDPRWTSDGILATAPVDGAWNVVRIAPDTGTATLLTRTLGGASTPSPGPDGALWFSETTAYGLKSTRLAAADLLEWPIAPAPAPPSPPVPRTEPPDPHPYRFAPVRPALGPILRVDSTTGVPTARTGGPAGLRAAAGGWLDLHDPLRTWALEVFALWGTVSGGHADLSWSRLGPPLGVRVDASGTPFGPRSVTTGTLYGTLRWNDGFEIEPALVRIAASGPPGGALRSTRLTLDLRGSDPPDRADRTSWATGWVYLTVADSAVGEGPGRPWARAEVEARGRWPLELAVGPLDEQATALEVRVAAGATSTDVSEAEELALGGDLDAAWRPLAVEATDRFPALPPYALTGEHRAAAAVRWVVPVAPRLRRAAGPLYLQGFEVAGGADLGGAWAFPLVVEGAPVTVALGAEVRMYAQLAETPWNSTVGVAQAWGGAPPRLQLAVGAALP